MAEEVSEAFTLSYGLLAADAELAALVGTHIYQSEAPQGIFNQTALYLLGTFISGNDVWGNGGVRLMTDALILWRVVKRGQPNASAKSADARMDAVLTNVRAQTSGGQVLSIVRERPYLYPSRDAANNSYVEMGGYYRHFIRPA